MQQMVGGCLCGKVRYAAEADPVFTAVCHCKNCQKQAGTSFSVVVAIPASALSMTGSLKTFEDVGDSAGDDLGFGQGPWIRFVPEGAVAVELEFLEDVIGRG